MQLWLIQMTVSTIFRIFLLFGTLVYPIIAMLCVRLLARINCPNYGNSPFVLITQLRMIQDITHAAVASKGRSSILTNSFSSSVTGVAKRQPKKPDVGIIKRVLKKVGLVPNSKSRLKVTSHILYESVADKIDYLTFFQYFNMPNSFNSWFVVTELHVWMLLVRSMAEGAETGDDGRYLRNSIVEAMWEDVNTRAKKLGAQNPSRTREQIQLLSEQFQAALIAYDEGIMSDDRVMAGALWRRFFEMKTDRYDSIELLVKYVRSQIVMLDILQKEEFLTTPKITWLDLKTINIGV